MTVHVARFAELTPRGLYALLRLRCDVFVVEQRCAYPELDGRDLEPDTLHLWLDGDPSPRRDADARPPGDEEPVGYLRVLADPDGTARIGRVCTAPGYRGRGVATRLVAEALARIGPDRRCALSAQTQLVDFYRQFGFGPIGAEFLDHGIPHVEMLRRLAVAPAGRAD